MRGAELDDGGRWNMETWLSGIDIGSEIGIEISYAWNLIIDTLVNHGA